MTDLSPRQAEVLALVATGATNAEIATALGLSEETVRRHLRRAYDAIGCAAGQMNRVQAAVWWTGTTYTTALMALTTRETAE